VTSFQPRILALTAAVENQLALDRNRSREATENQSRSSAVRAFSCVQPPLISRGPVAADGVAAQWRVRVAGRGCSACFVNDEERESPAVELMMEPAASAMSRTVSNPLKEECLSKSHTENNKVHEQE
jgi:hypothetical protein